MTDPAPCPEGYDPQLWDSIPWVRAARNPGQHETFVFGQRGADGTACIACSWQTNEVLHGDEAMAAHDESRKGDKP